MSFWQIVKDTSGIGDFLLWGVIGFILIAFLLFNIATSERKRIRASMFIFALSFIGLLAASAISYFGSGSENFSYRSIRFVSLFFASIAIINLAGVFFFGVFLKSLRIHIPLILRDLILAIAYIITIITLLSRNGVDLAGIVATSAVITAVIAFSLQDTLGNILGGLALQMENTINVGDWIRINELEGRVQEIRWRQTSIETRNWDTIIIPNSTLMKGQFTVLGRRQGMPLQHRQWIYFNVDFRYAPSEVIQTVEDALQEEPIQHVALVPPPHCIAVDFKESYTHYAVRYWLTDLAIPEPTDSVVRSRIFTALRRAEIPLSIPAQALFITDDDESRRVRKQKEEIERRSKALKQIELFNSLTTDECQELAMRMKYAPFVRGEVMTRQGAQADWLYLILEGEAQVDVNVEGKTEKVATLRSGDYFGEMALMTGQRRHANVIAITDVICYQLDKEAFENILRNRPEIAEYISRTLAKRSVELESIKEELKEEVMNRRVQSKQNELLHLIRDFFGLEDTSQFQN
ncbi:MAG: mechanosensitive ion channel family protein [Acidobacteriota bacterium]